MRICARMEARTRVCRSATGRRLRAHHTLAHATYPVAAALSGSVGTPAGETMPTPASMLPVLHHERPDTYSVLGPAAALLENTPPRRNRGRGQGQGRSCLQAKRPGRERG